MQIYLVIVNNRGMFERPETESSVASDDHQNGSQLSIDPTKVNFFPHTLQIITLLRVLRFSVP